MSEKSLVSAAVPGELWSAELSGTKILTVRSVPDVSGDGHQDVFAVGSSADDSVLFLLNGNTGSIIRSRALGFVASEALFIASPSVRIAVAYSGGIRIHNVSLNQLGDFATPFAPSHLTTFTGNEVVFYYVTESTSCIDSYSLTKGTLNWQRTLSASEQKFEIQDMLVLSSSRLLCLCKSSSLSANHYRAYVFSDTNSQILEDTDFGENTVNDNLALSYYNSTHFLYERATTSGRFMKLSTFKGKSESVAWKVAVSNEQGNKGFTITDVNKDGANDAIAIIGGNLGVFNGKNGGIIYTVGEISSTNVTSIAVVDDLDGDAINEVAVRADKSYLISFKPSTYNILWQQNFGSEGLSAIQDINEDDYKDVVAATGVTVTAFQGSPPKVATPTFSPVGGTYSSTPNVVISCATTGATIRYTTDNTEPTSSSTAYTAPISVSANITIKAKAFKSKMADSETASATYTIILPRPPVSKPTFSPPAGSYSSTQSVTIQCATSEATIRFTLDGSEPSLSSTLYSTPISVSSTITIKAKAFKSLMPDSDTASATYEIIPKVSTPTFSPDGGTYSSTQNVAISCSTTGATIRFTVDGSEPSSSSTLYSSQILVSTTTTIKAKAFVAGITDSDTASATYTISAGGKVATPTFSPVGGSYSSAQSVVIQCATSGATIRYTTDGYEPGSSSAAYFGPISVSSTTTIKAKALMLGMTDSDIATSTYTITPTPSTEPLYVLIGVVAIVAIGLTVGEVLHRKKGNKEPT